MLYNNDDTTMGDEIKPVDGEAMPETSEEEKTSEEATPVEGDSTQESVA